MLRYILILNLIVSIPLFCSEETSLQSTLQKAILNDSNIEVENAIKMGARISFEKSSQSPLLRAVLLKKFNATTTLLKAGCNPNITYRDEKVIHYLIKQGALKIANDFINAKADFSGIIEEEQDAFTYVSSHFSPSIKGQQTQPHFDLMHSMIKHDYGLKGNFKNKNLLNNAWYLAIKNGDVNNIGFFLSWNKKVKDNPYELSVTGNCNKIFIHQDKTTWTPLLIAIKHYAEHEQKTPYIGSESSLLTLMHYGNPDPNKKAKPLIDKPEQNALSFFLLLHESIDTRPETIIKALLDSGACLTEGFDVFISSGGSPNHIIKSGKKLGQNFLVSLLWIAINHNDVEAVKFLISKNVDINLNINPFPIPPQRDYNKEKDPSGSIRGLHTPLHFALHKEDTSIAELLIEHGAKI